jgi:hypothetical protein
VVEAGGSTRLALTKESTTNEWNILKKKSNQDIYSFISKLPVHESARFTITAKIDENNQAVLTQEEYTEENIGQLFYLNKQ